MSAGMISLEALIVEISRPLRRVVQYSGPMHPFCQRHHLHIQTRVGKLHLLTPFYRVMCANVCARMRQMIQARSWVLFAAGRGEEGTQIPMLDYISARGSYI